MTPRLAMLVNGSSGSIEAVRACGLAQNHPKDQRLMLFREGSRRETANRWHSALDAFSPEVIYVINTARPGIQLALQWRRSRGVPYVLDTGDAVFAMAKSAGTVPWWQLPALWAGERLAQRNSAHIVVRGTRHRDHLLQAGSSRVTVIRDGFVDRGETDEQLVRALRSQLGLDGSFVVGLMGSLVFSPKLQMCYGWDLVEALSRLRDLPVKGLVIGDGDGRAWLETKSKSLGVTDRLIFSGRINYESVPLYLRLLDVAMSTQTNNLAGQVRTTGKLPEYMAAGRFIMASRVGEAALVLPESMLLDYHGAVDAGYPARLAHRIRELVANPSQLALRDSLPAMARDLFSYDVLSREFDRVIALAAAR